MNTDAELLSRTIAGDSGAFAELYNRYKSELYCYARAILRDRALAEDVIHDTFIQLFKAGHTIHSPGLFASGCMSLSADCLSTLFIGTNILNRWMMTNPVMGLLPLML